MAFFRKLFGWLTGGVLDRVLDTVDKRMEADSDRDKLKADLIKTHLETREKAMKAGMIWLMWAFAGPFALWFASVMIYSILWCANCAFPQPWTIAALPSPLDEWAGLMITAIFGVVGLNSFRR